MTTNVYVRHTTRAKLKRLAKKSQRAMVDELDVILDQQIKARGLSGGGEVGADDQDDDAQQTTQSVPA